MKRSEYNRICSEIITWHPNYESGSSHFAYYGGCFYGFDVIMPGTYKFTPKMKIEGNEDKIKEWREHNAE